MLRIAMNCCVVSVGRGDNNGYRIPSIVYTELYRSNVVYSKLISITHPITQNISSSAQNKQHKAFY